MINLIQPNKYLPTLIQLLAPLAVWFGLQENVGWEWWGICLFWFFVYRVVGHGVALHRFYSHGQFTTSRVGEWILAWTSLMSCIGSPLSYTMTHLVHHKYPDTDLDPHGPAAGLKSFLYFWHRAPEDTTRAPVFARRVQQLQYYMWMHKSYWLLIILNAVMLWAIDWKVFLFMWWLPMTFTLWELAFTTYVSHWGPSGWFARNHPIGILIPVHEYLHKTHHEYPMLSNHAIDKWQIDYTHWVSKLFAIKYKQEELSEDAKAARTK